MLVENSTELLAQTVLPVREPRMAWGKNNPVGEAKGIYPGRVVWTHAPGAATWEKGDGFGLKIAGIIRQMPTGF